MPHRSLERIYVSVVLASTILASRPAAAVELYSFFGEHCDKQTGILAHVDAKRVLLVALDGKPAALPAPISAASCFTRCSKTHCARSNPAPS
jgi:hypothetical protein